MLVWLVHSFLMGDIPFCEQTTFFLFICLLMYMTCFPGVSYKCSCTICSLCRHRISFPLGTLLSHWVGLGLLNNCQTLLQIGCNTFHSLERCIEFLVLHIFTSTHYCHIFNFSHLVGAEHHLIVVTICNFLTANNVEHLFIYLFSVSYFVKHLFMFFAHI